MGLISFQLLLDPFRHVQRFNLFVSEGIVHVLGGHLEMVLEEVQKATLEDKSHQTHAACFLQRAGGEASPHKAQRLVDVMVRAGAEGKERPRAL